MQVISVTKAEYKGDYNILLEFDDGFSGLVNLEKHIEGEVFQPLKSEDYFKKFSLGTWTIGWENGADFSPEFLYELAKNKITNNRI